jgi:hypothetical protein
VNKNIYFNTLLVAIVLLLDVACKKSSELNQIPDSNLLIINDASDARAALDYFPIMRETPGLMEISADNFYLYPDSTLQLINPAERNAYLWNPDIFQGEVSPGDWFLPYQQVYYANSVLTTLPRLSGTAEELRQIKGTALFIRAYAFHNLALEFAPLYDEATAETDRGIPLRLIPDPEAPSIRASVKKTYDRILSDLKEASTLLPRTVDAKRKNRPSVPAAFALLAKVYLSMSDYPNAKAWADSSLGLYSKLLDYNAVNNGFTNGNEEVLYQSNLLSKTSTLYVTNCYVDSVLYKSFQDQDLRKHLFFTIANSGLPVPRFSYSGDFTRFSGLAVDEIFLIRAECSARLNLEKEALKDITTLLQKRWKNNAYSPPSLSSATEVLELVLQERRKELVFRGLRWTDLRRLNKINPTITLTRLVNGKTLSLPPGDKRYVLPIPPDVIAFNPGMPQNPR